MRKRPTTSRKRKTQRKRPVRVMMDSRRSGVLVLMIWTAIALFA